LAKRKQIKMRKKISNRRKRRKSQKPHKITQKCPLGAKSIKGIENERNGSQSADEMEMEENGIGNGNGNEMR